MIFGLRIPTTEALNLMCEISSDILHDEPTLFVEKQDIDIPNSLILISTKEMTSKCSTFL